MYSPIHEGILEIALFKQTIFGIVFFLDAVALCQLAIFFLSVIYRIEI